VHHGNLSYFQVDYSLVVALLLVERQVNFIIQNLFLDDGPIKMAHCNPKKEKKGEKN